MAAHLPSSWSERILVFARFCYNNNIKLPPEEAINFCLIYAGYLAEADLTLFISKTDQTSGKVIASSDPSLNGSTVNMLLRHSGTDKNINLLRRHHFEIFEEKFADLNYFLAIPIQGKLFEGNLVLGYHKYPQDYGILKEFAGLIQEISREMINCLTSVHSSKIFKNRMDLHLNSVPEGLIFIDENGNNAWLNLSAAKILSLPDKTNNISLVKEGIFNLFKNSHLSKDLGEELVKSLNNEQNTFEENTWNFSHSNEILNISCSPVKWGNNTGKIWILKTDINSIRQIKAENKSKDSSELLLSVLNSSPSGIMTFISLKDQYNKIFDFKCLLANETVKKFIPIDDDDEYIEKRLSDIFPYNFTEGFFEKCKNVVETGKPLNIDLNYEYRKIVKIIQVTVVKLDDCIVLTLNDVTEKRKTEANLSNHQKNLDTQLLNNLYKHLPLITFSINTEGKVISTLGSALKENPLYDKDLLNFIRAKFAKKIKNKVKDVNNNTVHFLNKWTYQGKKYFFESYLFPDASNPGLTIGFSIDVTEVLNNEKKINQSGILVNKDYHGMHKFLANLSHDLRTPLHTILGFSQLLKNQKLSSDSYNYLNFIISSGELLLNLVDDIHQISKVEEGKMALNEEPFNLKELLLSNLKPYQFQAKNKGLDFKLYYDELLPTFCIGDARKISRVLLNLVGNSLKFTSKGYIKIRFSCLDCEKDDTIKKLGVSVADSGIGISKGKHKLIFKSFAQADSSISSKFGGSGLGLAIVKEFVELMGGEFGVTSPINEDLNIGGKGSEFYLVLPLKEIKTVEQPQNKTQFIKKKDTNDKLNVLLAEDNQINQQLVKIMLDKLGCVVTIAENGREAIKILESAKYDLILMDVQMPDVNGIETTRIIRKKLNIKTPIIGLSANNSLDDIENFFESGMNDFIGKPFSEKSLQEKIYNWTHLELPKFSALPSYKDKKLTNLSFLENLYDGDIKSVEAMVEDFFMFQNQLIEMLEENIITSDFKNIASIAHKMKSSLKTIGLNSLYDPLVILEHTAKTDQDQPKIIEAFRKIKEISQKASKELENMI